MAPRPVLRWGIVATGLISAWFVEDLLLDRPDAPITHEIQAIGSSSLDKARRFVAQSCPDRTARLYDSYQQVYEDPDVDVVYIGTPHGYHHRDCLAAIAAGKNILCEKAFTLNARQAREIFEAARAQNVYVAEAMWLRHRPLVQDLQRLLHEEKVLGEVVHATAHFALQVDFFHLPPTSRYRDLTLGAGSLLDTGIYSLTWVTLALDAGNPSQAECPTIKAFQTHQDGIEVGTSAILEYSSTGRHGIATSTNQSIGPPSHTIAWIYGTEGCIEIKGETSSEPDSFTVYGKDTSNNVGGALLWGHASTGRTHRYPRHGRGFVHEADHTALDVLAGRKESATMPWSESIRMMEVMDEIRRQGGTRYAVDE
ncbi:hypothetical protein BDV25DRAFT_18399 [Aspergillus avenaceus]|uniref:D-xylose 1-dehydrogenase (NADP(+), D-xylono-1,5-lactone-forming) n=1 Tax=Aspergillus avenaceus TaxID=36643 RepID=A0A5N6U562_ASPAV|nr:hypothetical protein BDV25DRAFT_18399 [Aspergillus avenaceus]